MCFVENLPIFVEVFLTHGVEWYRLALNTDAKLILSKYCWQKSYADIRKITTGFLCCCRFIPSTLTTPKIVGRSFVQTGILA